MPGEYLFGILLIVAGIIFLVRQIFNLPIPVFRILMGIFFIYIGISILIGGTGFRSAHSLVFSSGRIHTTNLLPEYNLIFSSGTVDLTGVVPQDTLQRTKVNAIFSDGVLMINPGIPVAIKVNSAFSQAEIPNDTSINFGNYNYTSGNYSADANRIEIDASVVFGRLRIIERSP